jgi:hypothetical protein
MKTKYTLMLIYENGEGYKIVGIKEGCDPYDYISKKHDQILEPNRGTIEISGDIHHMSNYIEVDVEYYLDFDEEEKYVPEED